MDRFGLTRDVASDFTPEMMISCSAFIVARFIFPFESNDAFL